MHVFNWQEPNKLIKHQFYQQLNLVALAYAWVYIRVLSIKNKLY